MEQLPSSRLRNTKKRSAVLEVLTSQLVPLTAETIHQHASASVAMNLSTTYRTLTTLYEHGIVNKIVSHQGVAFYSLQQQKHHHSLICNSCNQIIPIGECPLHELEEQLEKTTGFVITNHYLELVGTCPTCQKAKSTQSI